MSSGFARSFERLIGGDGHYNLKKLSTDLSFEF